MVNYEDNKLKKTGILLAIVLLSDITTAARPFNVYFDSVSPFMEDNDTLIFDGMRIDGFGFSASKDAFRVQYDFDYTSLNYTLNPNNIEVYSNIGVFHSGHMAIDVDTPQPDYSVNGITYHFGEAHSFEATSNQPFIAEMNLQAGHVISLHLTEPSSDYSRSLTGSNLDVQFLGTATQNVISGSSKILKDGIYRLTIMPRNSSSLAFKLRLFNANHTKIQQLADNDNISVSFINNIRNYAKFKIVLGIGDTLTLSKSDTDIQMKLVNNRGKKLVSVLSLIHI